jgi:hypothetical protein
MISERNAASGFPRLEMKTSGSKNSIFRGVANDIKII